MKMIRRFVLCCAVFVCGCSIDEQKTNDEILSAINASAGYAKVDIDDFKSYHVRSVDLLANGASTLYESSSADENEKKIMKDLKGRVYWQICYGYKDMGVAAATYCFFVDYSSHRLLARYHIK